MMSVDTFTPETAYASKPNIAYPKEAMPTAAHLTAAQTKATTELNQRRPNVTVTATTISKER